MLRVGIRMSDIGLLLYSIKSTKLTNDAIESSKLTSEKRRRLSDAIVRITCAAVFRQ